MFKNENLAIVVSYPKWDNAEIYFLHDIHYGSAQFNEKKYESLKKEILEKDNALVC